MLDLQLDDVTLQLYKNVFSPFADSSLAFIGFVQPASGGVLSMSEIQARWWAELCRGNVHLPSADAMLHNIAMEKVCNRSASDCNVKSNSCFVYRKR